MVWVAKMIAIRIQALLEADVATDNIVGEPWLAELYIDGVANRLSHATKYSKLVLPLPVQPVCGRDVHAPGIGTDLVHHHKLLACGYGSGRSKSGSTIEKIAVFVPIPKASVKMTVTANSGVRSRPRH